MVKNLLAKIAAKKKAKEPQLTEATTDFKVGDLVKIKSGMFVNQEGRITHLNKRGQKVKIRVENSGAEITNILLVSCQKVFD
jgi:transcription antitermination factor NusG